MINELKQRIKICRTDKAVDSTLGTDEPSADILLKTVWADIKPRTGSLLSGREAGTMLSKTTHLIRVRSEISNGITNDCFIKWTDEFKQEHVFDIDYVLPPAGSKYTNIYCTEVIRNGI